MNKNKFLSLLFMLMQGASAREFLVISKTKQDTGNSSEINPSKIESYSTSPEKLKVSVYDNLNDPTKPTKTLSESYIQIIPTNDEDIRTDLQSAFDSSSAAYNGPSSLQKREQIGKKSTVKAFHANINGKKIPAGFVSTDKDGNITVAYHGTEFTHGNQDAWTDVNILPKDAAGIGIQGQAHRGFLDRYLQSRDAVKEILDGIKNKEDRSLMVTGHSLGAALATLGAADWAKKNNDQKIFKDIKSFVFSTPQVFDQNAANHVNGLLYNKLFRIFKEYDPVTYQIPGLEDAGQGLVSPGIDHTSAENHYLKNFDLGKKDLTFQRPKMRVQTKLYNKLQSLFSWLKKSTR